MGLWTISCAIALLLLTSCCLAVPLTDEEVRASPLLVNFDWKAYCQLYTDLPLNKIDNEEKTRRHYLEFGIKEGRLLPRTVPEEPEYSAMQAKLTKHIRVMTNRKIPMQDRSLVVFHIGKIDIRNSIEVILNNLKIFQSAMALDPSGANGVFYLFNIVDGADNMLYRHVDASAPNAALNVWSATPSDIYTHLRTLSLFSATLTKSFGSVFFLNNGVRGPLLHREQAQWLRPFHRLLFANNVAMVGATMSCEIAPHVQTHFFGLRTSVIPVVTAEYDTFRVFADWPALIRFYEVGLTELLLQRNYNVSTLFYQHRLGQDYFSGQCIQPVRFAGDHTVANPSRWCDVTSEEVVMYKWGGDMLRTNGFICEQTKARMRSELQRLSVELKGVHRLELPETLRGGSHYDLFKQYEQEMHRVRPPLALKHTPSGVKRRRVAADKVCLLVRTASMHDVQRNTSLMNRDVFEGLDNFITSLLRQTDEHWEAFFLITDQKPFASRLKDILAAYNDTRLSFMHINRRYRKPYTKEDAGYTATDVALRKVLGRGDCQWLSATNADNIYGTEVVERVRRAGTGASIGIPNSDSASAGPPPDMILIPIDSRNFMYQDFQNRKLIRQWDQMCVGLESMLEITLLGFTTQPRPVVGRVDLAGVFFSRPRLLAENIFFGNFTHKHKYPCSGCQDGYFTEYLTTQRGWKYVKLPIDGLRSILFHGPSPLWCVAAGHVWFSHPEVNKVKCYSQRTADAIRMVDRMDTKVFDWFHFDKSDRMCLRLSEYGYDRRDKLG